MRLSSLPALAAALLAGCSSSSGNGSPGDGGPAEAATTSDAGDAGATGDASPGDAASGADAPGDAGAACNSLANAATTVTIQQVAQDPPQPQGGPIADGTYTLTDVTVFTGPHGTTGSSGTSRVTLAISGNTIQVVADGTPKTQTVTLSTSGTAFTGTDTCPDTKVTQGSYTATASTFVVILDGGTDDAGARTLVETFTMH